MDLLSQEAMKLGIEVVLDKYVDPLLQKVGSRLRQAKNTGLQGVLIDTNLAFREYLRNTFETCSRIKTIIYRTEPKYLYDFFEIPIVKKEVNMWGGIRKCKAISLDDFLGLADETHFVILKGNAGIGKTTLLKHLFLDELTRNDLIPVYLQLKEVNNISDEINFRHFILNELHRHGCKIDEAGLEYALESGCFLFLLDGYDEIKSDHSSKFSNALSVFCDQYPKNYYVVSSRPRIDSYYLGGNRFVVLEACPFDLEQAVSLIQKVGYDASVQERFCEALKNGLFKTHYSFASNPLLLIIMLITYDNYAEIPEKLHVFYEESFDVMYRRHDATEDGYRRERKSGIRDYDDFRMVFACFCFISYTQGETEFSWDRLASIFQHIKELSFCKTHFIIENYIDDLKAMCLIYQDGLRYLFTHRSFQEYFTAVFLSRQIDVEMKALSLQLIMNDPIRARTDSVFMLIKGISEDKFYNNIALPILELFENRYFKEKQNYDNCQFLLYFSNLFRSILFVPHSLHNIMKEGDIENCEYWKDHSTGERICFKRKNVEDPIWVIYRLINPATWHYKLQNYSYGVSDSSSFLDYLACHKLNVIEDGEHTYISGATEYDYRNYLEDSQFCILLQKTPVGKCVLQLAELRDQIELQKNKRSVNLSNLMKRQRKDLN